MLDGFSLCDRDRVDHGGNILRGDTLPGTLRLCVKLLKLRQLQPAATRALCDGVELQLSVDLPARSFIYGRCEADAGDAKSTPSLRIKNGKLGDEQLAQLGEAYARLSHAPAAECRQGGGELTLTITRKDESAASFVDANWTCASPAPELAIGLRDFSRQLVGMVAGP